jgi:hypothetical protein
MEADNVSFDEKTSINAMVEEELLVADPLSVVPACVIIACFRGRFFSVPSTKNIS